MTFTPHDRRWMERALELAEEARGLAEPNPPVGAVLVRDGHVVGSGHTQPYGGPHAEVVALEDAGECARGATMYVTLEPCAHQGKTPPCAPRVVEAGVQRVAIAVLDPTPKTHRKGVELLRKAGVEVQVGLCREQAVRGNAAFFKLAAVAKPLVIAKWAMTADGKIATRTGDSRWISGPESRRRVHEVRGIVDCIIVGGRTARQDDPLLTCRDAEKRRTAARLVLCGRGVPSHDSRLVQTADEAPVLLAYPEKTPSEGLEPLLKAGCTAVPLPALEHQPTRVAPSALLEELGRREMSNVLVEGGSEVLGSFLDAGEVDRVMVFVAPLLVGGSQAPSAVGGVGPTEMRSARQLSGVKVSRTGCDVLVEGRLTDPMEWAR